MTNQEPKTRPINKSRSISSLFPARFLKPAQLLEWGVTFIIVVISRMVEEEVEPKPGKAEFKPVIYFKAKDGSEHPQGYLLSAKVDAISLEKSTGAANIEELIGKRIRIKLGEYRHKSVLRIDPLPVAVTAPNAAEPKSDPEPAHTTDPETGEPSGF